MAQRYALQDIRLRALGKEDLPLLMSWENAPEALRSNDSLNPLSEDFIARYISSSTRHPRDRIYRTDDRRDSDQHPLRTPQPL